LGKFQEEPGYVNHTGGFIHDHHSSRAHDRSGLVDGFVINRGIQQFFGYTAARGASQLDSFDFLVTLDPAPDVKDHFSQSQSHRHFYQPALLDLAC
jgi:hypothetical protein